MKVKLNNDTIERVVILYDDSDECYSFYENEIPECIEQMKVERYLCVNEKLIIVKVKGVINE
jgi:hypothetical protein